MVLGNRTQEVETLSPTGLSPSLADRSRPLRLAIRFLTSRRNPSSAQSSPATPTPQRLGSWHGMGLGCSRFVRHYSGNRCCFLFLEVLRCFSSLGSLRRVMYWLGGNGTSLPSGFPIRRPPDRSLFAAPRGFSQLTASFFGCLCQGIHRTPLVA